MTLAKIRHKGNHALFITLFNNFLFNIFLRFNVKYQLKYVKLSTTKNLLRSRRLRFLKFPVWYF